MKINIVVDISPPISYLANFSFSSYLKKEMNDEVFFDIQINIEVFSKQILSFWVCVARDAQSTQKKKLADFAISLEKCRGCS